MKIECVVTSVGYADFLAETLCHNRVLFDKLVVVTAPEDKATRRVCEYWNVTCIPTDLFETRWGSFYKGRGINVGLEALDRDAYLLHMDADILLPPLTRKFLEFMNPDPEFLYGIDRHVCRDYQQWRRFMSLPQLQHESRSYVHLDKFPLGTRLCVEAEGWGYIPLGFFQLWHAASGRLTYPEQHSDAGRTDTVFAMQWTRAKRSLIPEIVGYHLESADAHIAANWSGRTTAPFGPPDGILSPPVAAAEKPGETRKKSEYHK